MKQRFAFSAEPKDVKEFDKIAKDNNLSRSSYIAYLVKQIVKKEIEERSDNGNTN